MFCVYSFLGNKSYSAGTGVPDGPLDEIWSLEGEWEAYYTEYYSRGGARS